MVLHYSSWFGSQHYGEYTQSCTNSKDVATGCIPLALGFWPWIVDSRYLVAKHYMIVAFFFVGIYYASSLVYQVGQSQDFGG